MKKYICLAVFILTMSMLNSCSDNVITNDFPLIMKSPYGTFLQPFNSTNAFENQKSRNASVGCFSTITIKEIEFLSFSIDFTIKHFNDVHVGDKLEIEQFRLAKSISSELDDFISGHEGSVYVQGITPTTITLYLDHIKFNQTRGFHLRKGKYDFYGSVTFLRNITQ